MINHNDLNTFVKAIVNIIARTGCHPSTRELADELFMSKGSVERRLQYLKDMGLARDIYRKGIHLTGEVYLPPTWAGDQDFLFEKLPQKNQNLSRSNNGSQT